MSRKKKEIILENVRIESVAAEGKAIARIDGTVLFVQFAVPGDIVDVKVTKMKKNYMEGFILRMVSPSPDRLEPFCSIIGTSLNSPFQREDGLMPEKTLRHCRRKKDAASDSMWAGSLTRCWTSGTAGCRRTRPMQ